MAVGLVAMAAVVAGGWAVSGYAGGPVAAAKADPAPEPRAVGDRPVAGPGRPGVCARAKVTGPFRDAVLWWAVEVRRYKDDGSLEVAWSHDYGEVPRQIRAAKGVTVQPELDEELVPMDLPAGTYHAFVGLREDAQGITRAGQVIEAAHLMVGRASDPVEVR